MRNGKRFMAYEIIKILKALGDFLPSQSLRQGLYNIHA